VIGVGEKKKRKSENVSSHLGVSQELRLARIPSIQVILPLFAVRMLLRNKSKICTQTQFVQGKLNRNEHKFSSERKSIVFY